jgi:hypothetical protein
MKKASAKYIMFLDNDDAYEVNVCETVYETIKSEDLDFVWFKHLIDDNKICFDYSDVKNVCK